MLYVWLISGPSCFWDCNIIWERFTARFPASVPSSFKRGNICVGVWYAADQLTLWENAFEWSLCNPRCVTTHIFLASETNYLAQFSLLFNLVVLVLFLSVEIYRHTLIDEYGPWLRTVGLGVFQIINIRHSGFTSIAMSELTESTLVVFCMTMYLSPLPFIGMLTMTGENLYAWCRGCPLPRLPKTRLILLGCSSK